MIINVPLLALLPSGSRALWIAFIAVLVLLIITTLVYMLHNRRRLKEEEDERSRLAAALELTKKRQKAAEEKLADAKSRQAQTEKALTDARSLLQTIEEREKDEETAALKLTADLESEKRRTTLATTAVLVGSDYELVSLIDLDSDSFQVLGAERSGELQDGAISYTEASRSFALESCVAADRDKVLYLTSVSGLREQLKDREFFELTTDVIESGQPKRKIMRFTRFDEHGSILLATRRDVTELMEREVRQKSALTAALLDAESAEEKQTGLLSSVSASAGKRFNDVLILSSAAEGEATDEASRQAFRTIRETGGAMVSMLADLTDVLELTSGKRSPAAEPTDASDFMAKLGADAKTAASEKKLRYTLKSGGAAPKRLSFDSRRAARAVSCSLSVVLERTPEGGEINHTVTYSPPLNGRVYMRHVITTNAPELTPEELSAAFLPFANESEVGGLYIAKHLAEALGGSLDLSPAALTLTLPGVPQ